MRTFVIGGGISGLTAAYRLREAGADVHLFEASERLGGLLGSECFDGFEVELGADSILSDKPWAIALAKELGLADQLLQTREGPHGAYIVHRGKLVRVPEGFSLMAPTDLLAFARTPILSLAGKLRALLDLTLPRRTELEDESLEDFVVRRLGKEVFERLAQPLVGGIYGADPKLLSLSATMPRFVDLEREHGSVIRGLMATRKRATGRAAVQASGARYSMFTAFRGGMQTLINALQQRLGDVVSLQHRITSIAPAGAGYAIDVNGARHTCDALVVALPAHAAGTLLAGMDGTLGAALSAIPYGSAATITGIWDARDVPHPLDAYGFVVPAVEQRDILAATWASAKWPDRAPPGKVLLRVFVGGHTGQHLVARSDADLLAISARELRALMGIAEAPSWTRVVRYMHAMPQYHVGHRAHVARIETLAAAHPGLALAGNAYHGVGISDAVKSGNDAAERLLNHPY